MFCKCVRAYMWVQLILWHWNRFGPGGVAWSKNQAQLLDSVPLVGSCMTSFSLCIAIQTERKNERNVVNEQVHWPHFALLW